MSYTHKSTRLAWNFKRYFKKSLSQKKRFPNKYSVAEFEAILIYKQSINCIKLIYWLRKRNFYMTLFKHNWSIRSLNAKMLQMRSAFKFTITIIDLIDRFQNNIYLNVVHHVQCLGSETDAKLHVTPPHQVDPNITK